MKPLRVLKLGWEFPPLINGGLGVACFGLSKALARHVDLTVVVPKADPNAAFPEFQLRGLDHLALEDLGPVEAHYRYQSFSEVREIPADLDPYQDGAISWRSLEEIPGGEVVFSQTTRHHLESFKLGELYGADLGNKVVEFSKVAAKLAMLEDFDLVHAHDWMTYLAGVEASKATGKPLVVHLHASQYDRAGSAACGWIFDIERYGMEQADRVVPVSRYTGEIAVRYYGVSRAKIRPIHNGADPVVAFTTRKKFPEKLVLFLGRLTAQKGPEYFLEIAARVLSITPNVRFVMAGIGEKLRPLVESGAYRGLGGHFHFTGFLDKKKVNQLLSMTDVYCMPSVSEPFGLSALEAAQFGIPAVISKQSGVAEVLKAALQADYWDVERMAGHIHRLLTDDALRRDVVSRAHHDIAASTWDAAARKVLDVYRELVP
jgi:glycogen(starch) synthase